ncbi:energy transducer TonB [Sphingopyxis sp.]|uniref:energy transducer TonB n=1 Tax=Sphingopyxis sp. TaxID=1908224 RepID=UPI002614E595|nr:energy transducer TonB [Sphingopyxis sp.]MCW0197061.1 energy transducer TonB [Sphingopyxis sp.]
MKTGGWVVGAGLLLSSAPLVAAEKDEPVMLEPSSPWNVNYADDYCRLGRVFGEGEQRTILIMDRYAPGDVFRLTLAGAATEAVKSGGEASVQFGPGWDAQTVRFFSGKLGEKLPAWIFAGNARIRPLTEAQQAQVAAEAAEEGLADTAPIAPISEADEAATTQLRFGPPLRRPLILHTGPMKKALDAMRACTDELVTHWGVDPKQVRTQSRPAVPRGSPGRWLGPDDYPRDMLINGMQGMIQFRLTIGEDGKPLSCHIQQSTDPDGFAKTVCQLLMRRARFEPALDSEGKPMKTYYLSAVRFTLP